MREDSMALRCLLGKVCVKLPPERRKNGGIRRTRHFLDAFSPFFGRGYIVTQGENGAKRGFNRAAENVTDCNRNNKKSKKGEKVSGVIIRRGGAARTAYK